MESEGVGGVFFQLAKRMANEKQVEWFLVESIAAILE